MNTGKGAKPSSKTSYRHALLAMTSGIGTLSAGQALAQVAPSQSGLATLQQAPVATDDGSAIPDIVVTARKRTENLQDTPIAVSAITGEGLKDRAIIRIDELVKISPGINIAPSANGPLNVLFQIRGQSQRDTIAALDSPIGIYSDGVYLNSSVGLLAASTVDLDRVEILKGSQGTLYGRNTTGGAVNFYTKQPTDAWEGQMTAGIGNYRNYETSAVVNAPLAEGVALRVVGQANRDGGFGYDDADGRRTGDREMFAVRGALRARFSPAFSLTLRGDYSNVRSNGGSTIIPLYLSSTSNGAKQIALTHGIITPAALASQGNSLNAAQIAAVQAYYGQFLNSGPDHLGYHATYDTNPGAHSVAYGMSATAELDLGSAQLKSITAYRHLNDRRSIDLDAIPDPIFYLAPFTTLSKQFSQEFQLNGSLLDKRLHYALGAFYYHSNGHDVNTSVNTPAIIAATPTFVDARVLVNSPALYGQATYDILSNVHVTGGLRYTWEKRKLLASNRAGPTGAICTLPPPAGVSGAPCKGEYPTRESTLSYLASIDWNINRDVMVYAKTSRGFKSGGVNERLSTNPLSITPFKPEVVTDYEVGLKSEWLDRRLRFNIDAFRSNYADIQKAVQVVDSLGRSVAVIQNAAKARIQGIEVDATVIPVTNLTIQGTLGYIDAGYQKYINPATGADLSSQDFDSTPKWTHGLSATYQMPVSFGSVAVGGSWTYVGSRNIYPTGLVRSINVQPGYDLFDAQLKLSLDDAALDVRLYVKNIADKKYLVSENDYTAVIGTISGVMGSRRTFGISATKRF